MFLYDLEEVASSDLLFEPVGVERIELEVVSVRPRWRTRTTITLPTKIVQEEAEEAEEARFSAETIQTPRRRRESPHSQIRLGWMAAARLDRDD
jgi:hypothetical protein